MATSPDFAILAAPRIGVPTFARILQGGSSPAAPEATGCYRAIAAHGVDPAVALAVFRKESTYGRFGRAARNRSWGNIRNPDGSFRAYSSWTAGAADVGRLLALYGSNQIRRGVRTDTVQTMPYVWAPSSDGNAPDAYGDSLARWIGEWSGMKGAPGAPNATPASSPGDDALTKWQAHLASVGIPNDPDHVFTHDEAVKIVDVLYPTVLGYRVPDRDNAVRFFEGKTVRASAAGGSTSPIPDPLAGLAAVADAIGRLPGALGDALIHLVILLGILALLGMGVWLVATSED